GGETGPGCTGLSGCGTAETGGSRWTLTAAASGTHQARARPTVTQPAYHRLDVIVRSPNPDSFKAPQPCAMKRPRRPFQAIRITRAALLDDQPVEMDRPDDDVDPVPGFDQPAGVGEHHPVFAPLLELGNLLAQLADFLHRRYRQPGARLPVGEIRLGV